MRYSILLAFVLLSGGPGFAATGDASLSADGNSVAFLLTRDGLAQGRIFVYDIAEEFLEEVSVTSSGEQANFDSFDRPAISADGQLIAFTSGATNLTSDPDNFTFDVFLRDRTTSSTTLPYPDQNGSQVPHLSADGSTLAFFGNQLVPEDVTTSIGEAYVVDLSDSSIQIASIDENDVQVGGGGTLNGDGTRYAFEKDDKIYLRDLVARTTELLGSFPATFTFFSDMSTDGNFVVFQTTAGLDAVDTNGRRDVYVIDTSGGAPELISYDQSGSASNRDSFVAAISSDGRYVAFSSEASDLVAGDLNGRRDVFLRDRMTGSLQRVSVSSLGVEGNGDSRIQDISADGMKVLFSSQATNLDQGTQDCIFQNSCNLFLHDVMTGTTTLIPPPDAVRAAFPAVLAPGDAFGTGVAVSGNLIAIGAPNDDDAGPDFGAVHIYALDGGVPVPDAKITVPAGFFTTGFGTAVALSGTTLVVGAPATGKQAKGDLEAMQCAVFERLQTVWTFKQPLTGQGGGADDDFGAAVAIDGGRLLVGAPGDADAGTDSGAAYSFATDGGLFVFAQKVTPASGGAGQRFGTGVALDAGLAAVGSPLGQIGAATTGIATLYQEIAGNLQAIDTVNGSQSASGDGFGTAVAINGTRLVVGAPGEDGSGTDQGAAYVFEVGASSLVETGRLAAGSPRSNAGFGTAVAASASGLAIGAPGENDGAAYRFDDGLSQQSRLVPRAGETGYGQAIALSADRLVVGAAETNSQAGAAVVESDPERLFDSGFE